MNFAVSTNIPFNAAQDESFNDVLDYVSGRHISIPSSYNVKNSLDDEFVDIKTQIIKVNKDICARQLMYGVREHKVIWV